MCSVRHKEILQFEVERCISRLEKKISTLHRRIVHSLRKTLTFQWVVERVLWSPDIANRVISRNTNYTILNLMGKKLLGAPN